MNNVEETLPTGYTEIFDLIEKAGGPGNFHKSGNLLTSKERQKVMMNYWAFFFTIFFYLKHRMWKKTLTLSILCIIVQFLIFYLAYDVLNISDSKSFDGAVSMALPAVLFATQANFDLYKKYRLNNNFWW
jgi:hypothetical protein